MTNCLTGKAEYIEEKKNKRRMMEAVRASSSLPFVSPMVYIDGKPMMDGGLTDSVPVQKAVRDGYKYNIVICTRPKGYRKRKADRGNRSSWRVKFIKNIQCSLKRWRKETGV